MLKFEKWLEKQSLNNYEKKFFDDSIICYKVNAYRPSFIMAYLGILVVSKNRILDKENNKPANINERLWEDAILKLKNELKWESSIIQYLENTNSDSIFKLKSDISSEISLFKTSRNRAVHARGNETSPVKIEYIWDFIENNLNKIQVGGGKEYITELIIDSFDRRKSNEKKDYLNEINQIKEILNKEEMLEFLDDIYEKFKNLDNYKIEKNIFLFYNSLISNDLDLRDSLIKHLINIENNFDICESFIYISKNFYTIYKELISNEYYIKKLWYTYIDIITYYAREDKFKILKLLIKENVLHTEDFKLFYNVILSESLYYTIYSLDDNEVIDILINNNFKNELLSRMNKIDFKHSSIAFKNQSLIHCVIKYCDIDKYTYEMVLYFLKKSYPITLIDGIHTIINSDTYKLNCIKYENINNTNEISKYMHWNIT